jgi:hypothetical protein
MHSTMPVSSRLSLNSILTIQYSSRSTRHTMIRYDTIPCPPHSTQWYDIIQCKLPARIHFKCKKRKNQNSRASTNTRNIWMWLQFTRFCSRHTSEPYGISSIDIESTLTRIGQILRRWAQTQLTSGYNDTVLSTFPRKCTVVVSANEMATCSRPSCPTRKVIEWNDQRVVTYRDNLSVRRRQRLTTCVPTCEWFGSHS